MTYPLDRLDETASLVESAGPPGSCSPKDDLPEVLLEVASWTGFIEEFMGVRTVLPARLSVQPSPG